MKVPEKRTLLRVVVYLLLMAIFTSVSPIVVSLDPLSVDWHVLVRHTVACICFYISVRIALGLMGFCEKT